jgi:hypothetical protein
VVPATEKRLFGLMTGGNSAVPIDLVATLLGHSNTDTTRKHYAKIIPQDRPNMAKLICGIMGISNELERIESEKQA